MRQLFRALLLAASIAAALLIAPDGASAHTYCDTRSPQVTDMACVNADHYTIYVSDGTCDRRNVYVIFYVRGISTPYDLWDSNGCNNGFVEWDLLAPVTRFQVCTSGVGCSGFFSA
jgi:hypothetical protein